VIDMGEVRQGCQRLILSVSWLNSPSNPFHQMWA